MILLLVCVYVRPGIILLDHDDTMCTVHPIFWCSFFWLCDVTWFMYCRSIVEWGGVGWCSRIFLFIFLGVLLLHDDRKNKKCEYCLSSIVYNMHTHKKSTNIIIQGCCCCCRWYDVFIIICQGKSWLIHSFTFSSFLSENTFDLSLMDVLYFTFNNNQ